MLKDGDILHQIADGDLSAFDELYTRYGKALYVFVFRYVGNHQESEEVVQEVFMRVVERRTEIADLSMKAWLYTVARNLALNRVRSNQRSEKRVRTERANILSLVPENGLGEFVKDGWDLNWVASEITRLSPIHREVYELRSSGQTYEEARMAQDTQLKTAVGILKAKI